MTTVPETARKMLDKYKRKNHDYGNSFHDTFVKYGHISAVTRISDKLSRWKSLSGQDGQVNDETIIDTILDAATYLVMFVSEMESPESSYDNTCKILSELTDVDSTLSQYCIRETRGLLVEPDRMIAALDEVASSFDYEPDVYKGVYVMGYMMMAEYVRIVNESVSA